MRFREIFLLSMILPLARSRFMGSFPPIMGLFLLSAGTVFAQEAADPGGVAEIPRPVDAFTDLQRAHADLYGLSARFTHTKEVPLFDEKISSSGTLFYRKPDELLLQYTEPDSSRVLITGGLIWLYYPSLQQAHRYEIDPEVALPGVFLGFGGSSEGVEERFDVETMPPDREGGFITDRIVLQPRGETDLALEVRSIELVIRRASHLPVRCEFWEVSGDHTLFEFSDYTINPDLDSTLFLFSPPEGTEVFEVEGESW